jgi:hypothetical protein
MGASGRHSSTHERAHPGYGSLGVILIAVVRKKRAAVRQKAEAATRLDAVMRQAEEMVRKRREMITAKYADETVRKDILDQKIWTGMTREQLIDAWGEPVGRSIRVLKTKTKETLSYGERGERSRVYLEGRVVVGWQQPV